MDALARRLPLGREITGQEPVLRHDPMMDSMGAAAENG